MEASMAYSQFIHLGCYGRSPRKGEPRWSCISGVTAEGARVPGACNHLRYRGEALVIFGISPIEAGRLAIERADQARDAGVRNWRLRRDGVALLAGVVSYPIPRILVDTDPVDQDVYRLWCRQTLEWLQRGFGDHLKSVVEHRDENFYHLHFFIVPTLGPGNRLNVNQLHPGRYAKVVAAAEGADHKNAERSYRQGMRKWQDEFHRDVSAFFGHDRYGPRRMRVSNRQHKMEKQMAERNGRANRPRSTSSAPRSSARRPRCGPSSIASDHG
jgi:hypothetical protein